MLNWIWLAFLLIAVLVGGFNGKLPDLTKGAFETAETAVMKIALPLIGLMAIWLGIMRLAERSGLVQIIARGLKPLMRRLFPDVPPEHPAMGAMVMNMAANMLGLGNAATPLGLRAMTYLEKLNPTPGTATNAMCTFLAINTASIQLLPTMAISQLALAGSQNPTAIVPAAFLATCCAAFSGVFTAKLLERLPMFRLDAPAAVKAEVQTDETALPEEQTSIEQVTAPPLTRFGRICLLLLMLAFAAMFFCIAFPTTVNQLLAALHTGLAVPPPPAEIASKGPVLRSLSAISVLAVPFLLAFFPLYAALRGVKVYEQFVEGAKEAFGVAQRIVPFLVAMLVAVRMLREAGVIDLVTRGLRPMLDFIGFPADLLPMVLMRPLSGSATQGIFVELINRVGPEMGPDSLVSRMAATIYGSTETTFYVLAVYFGSVAVRKTRHAVLAGLTADTVAVIASIAICRLMFKA
ncbi:MAG: nucleoside recognition domain-containing protein [Verrucomicrobiota bacterium]